MAICAYAQRDIPVGGSMEVASIESDDSIGGVGQGKQITMYKVKDNDKSDIKSLKFSFKISKKLHPDL